MSNFEAAMEYVLRNEKGLVNNLHDSGKITNHGISLRFLKSLKPEDLRKYGLLDASEQTIIDLTLEQALSIYRGEFWYKAPFEKILNQEHVNYIFDMAVNMGIAPAIKCAQRACWAVMKNRSLVDDGILGEKTLAAIKLCAFMLMPALRSERAGYYRLVLDKSPKEKEFINGWLNRAYESK